jgi:serine/threonine protein phosphatase 1
VGARVLPPKVDQTTGTTKRKSVFRSAASFLRFRKKAAIPGGERVYAVGDIHGRADLLDNLLQLIEKDCEGTCERVSLIFVGDYIDRGPNSKEVVDRLLDLPQRFSCIFLRGNHDQTLLNFLHDHRVYPQWQAFGGVETILSYGVSLPSFDDEKAYLAVQAEFARKLPATHRNFFETLQSSIQIGDYYFVHAGVRPGIPLDQQSPEDTLWIRDEFLRTSVDFGKIVVHGHTPENRPSRRANRIGIDTAAFASGRLTALRLKDSTVCFLST